MTNLEKDYQVFNPELAPHVARVSLTVTFGSAEDAAWIERAIVELKRDGHLSPLMTGILKSSLHHTLSVEVKNSRTNAVMPPEKLREVRMGTPA